MIVRLNEPRKATYKKEPVTFHGWTRELNTGVLTAVVELDDGTMRYARPHEIKFIDSPDPE